MACLAGASPHMHLSRRSLASTLFSDLLSPASFSPVEHMKIRWDEQHVPPSAPRSPRQHHHHHHHGPHPAHAASSARGSPRRHDNSYPASHLALEPHGHSQRSPVRAPTARTDPYIPNHRHLAHPYPHQLPLHIEDDQALVEWGKGMGFVPYVPPGAPHPFDDDWQVLSDLFPFPLSLILSRMFSAS